MDLQPSSIITFGKLIDFVSNPGAVVLSQTEKLFLLKMFIKNSDYGSDHTRRDVGELPLDLSNARERMAQAKTLYAESVKNKYKLAVFYKLTEKDAYKELVNGFRLEVCTSLIPLFKEARQVLKKVNYQKMQEILGKRMDELLKQTPRTIVEESKLQILNYLLRCDMRDMVDLMEKINSAKNPKQLAERVEFWFSNQKDPIQENLLASVFFKLHISTKEALANGVIYRPGGDAKHSWGVNLIWALGTAQNNCHINVLSVLSMENAYRKDKITRQDLEPKQPSAFSLEMAIAIKMGYGLHIVGNLVTLTPPNFPANLGEQIVPTKQEQMDIFRGCVYAKELHSMLLLPDGATALRTQVHAICVGQDNNAKLDLAFGLDLLGKGRSIEPILKALSLREIEALKGMLEAHQFDNAIYDNLKGAIDAARETALKQAQVDVPPPVRVNDEQSMPMVKVGIEEITIALSQKTAELDALDGMIKLGRGNPAPQILALREQTQREVEALEKQRAELMTPEKGKVVAEVSPQPRTGFQGRLSGLAAAFSLPQDSDIELGQLPPPPPPMTTQADVIARTAPRVADRVIKEPSNPGDKDKPKPPRSPSPPTSL